MTGCAASVLSVLLCSPAQAVETLLRSQYGNVGLIYMPSARMAPDGELSVSASYALNLQRYTLGFQALPWLETSFRYSGLEEYSPLYPVYFDRAFGMKVRLWDEGDLLPAFAIGTNDLIGTGIYSSEYIVASKRIGALDFTLGLGWGRMASANKIRNPLSLISSYFDDRVVNTETVGNFTFSRYFRGRDAGVFGGVTWKTALKGLTLVAEYSSDKYVDEASTNTFVPKNQFSFGVSYSPVSNVTFGLGWLQGRSIYGNFTLSLDPMVDNFPQRLGASLPPPAIRNEEEQTRALRQLREARGGTPRVDETLVDVLWERQDLHDVSINGETLNIRLVQASTALCASLARDIAPYTGDIRTITLNGATRCAVPGGITAPPSPIPPVGLDLPLTTLDPMTIDASGPARPTRGEADALIRRKVREQNLELLALLLRDKDLIIYYENFRYAQEVEAIDRLLRILMASAPTSIETFRLIRVASGMPQSEIEIPRGTAERSFAQQGSFNIFRDQGRYRPAPLDNLMLDSQRESYPKLHWNIFPQFRQQLFDPANPIGIQFLVGAEAKIEILPGLRLMGQAEANLFNDFNVNRLSDSLLPHVRTDFVRYFSQGQNGIAYLQMEYNFPLSQDVFATARAGYLESMFAGVGGEILWQPEGQRWALGWDLYHVKQRDFDRLFGFQPYTQTTGHMTLYYASPWYNLDFEFRIGHYLAGDWGSTVQVTRRFASGVEVGVFATKTNVSSAQFGEGSFDKGIIIRLPLNYLLPVHTQQTFGMNIRPVQRDGGQTLAGDAQLYERLRQGSEAELRRTALD